MLSKRKKSGVALATILGAAIAIPAVTATTASAASVSTWEKVAQCESGGNWSINTGNGYYGGLQFSASSWIAAGGGKYAATANLATEAQQISVAETLLASQGAGAWPTCGAANGLGSDTASANVDTSSGSSSSSSSSTATPSTSSTTSSTDTSSSDTSSSSSTDSSSTDSSSSSSTSSSSDTSSSTTDTTSTDSTALQGKTYTVKSGDTLSQIAVDLKLSGWHGLYADNKSTVGSNPDLIFPGQVLKY